MNERSPDTIPPGSPPKMGTNLCQPSSSLRRDGSSLQITERPVIIDTLVQIVHQYDLLDSTIHLAVNMLDRYLLTEKVSENEVEKISLVCLLLASKIEDCYYLVLGDLTSHNDKYSKCDILITENKILNALKYQLSTMTPYQYLNIQRGEKKLSEVEYHFCLYLCILCYFRSAYLYFSSQEITESMIRFSKTIFQGASDTDSQIIYSYFRLVMQKYHDPKYSTYHAFRKDKYANIVAMVPKSLPINCQIEELENYLQTCRKVSLPETIDIHLYDYEYFDNLYIVSRLGKGSYGTVYQVAFGEGQTALKKCDKRFDDDIKFTTVREIDILLKIPKHQNIVQILGLYNDLEGGIYINFELMECTLTDKIYSCRNSLPYRIRLGYIIQLLTGLDHIHRQNIIHRDISTNNILVRNELLKIADFGMSKYTYQDSYRQEYSTDVCSIYFRAFELLLNCRFYTRVVDSWSAGCVIGFILQGNYLFTGESENGMLDNIFKKLGTPHRNYYGEICRWPNFQGAFVVHPRVGFHYLETLFPQETEIVYGLLKYLPKERLTPEEALKQFQEIKIDEKEEVLYQPEAVQRVSSQAEILSSDYDYSPSMMENLIPISGF